MRTRLIVAGLAVALVAGGAFFVLGGDDGDGDDSNGVVSDHMMPVRSMTVGDVDVKIEPRSMNGQGAMFDVTLDTHQGSLGMDLERAQLMVGGVEWPMQGYDGDGPGGHHREGTMRFGPGGPVDGEAQLVMPGFGDPVTMQWGMPAASGRGGMR